MTIDEAIKHCEEVAERLEGKDGYAYTDSTCDECAKEHRQLAEWLRELRELRRNRIGRVSVGCATCIHMKTDDYTKRPCDICCNHYFSKYESEVNADEDSD
jgi:hypothetical protein